MTAESNALKKMRQAKGLSLKKASAISGIHDTVLNHHENGWCSITESYVEKFLKGMGFTQDDWELFLTGGKTRYDIIEECVASLSQLDLNKLKIVQNMLEGLR